MISISPDTILSHKGISSVHGSIAGILYPIIILPIIQKENDPDSLIQGTGESSCDLAKYKDKILTKSVGKRGDNITSSVHSSSASDRRFSLQ
jgi:hypothetical protein